jgi:glyoxylase-like metal-dependent hydrolase (beta-lactamase superfamily II)
MPDFRPVTPHIWRLTLNWEMGIPFYPAVPVAVWLVKDGADWTLVDAGHPSHAGQVMAALKRFLGADRPSRLVLTHAHIDHGGAAGAILSVWDTPLLAHALETGFVTSARRYRDVPSGSPAFQLAKHILAEPAWKLALTQPLAESDTVGGLAVIHVPGHTPGMIALRHGQDRAILCADAVMNLNGRLSEPANVSTPDPAEARRSIRKLAALDFDALLPSHDASERGVSSQELRRFAAKLRI